MTAKKHTVVIVGGGTGGLTTAARLKKASPSLDVAIIEPNEKHYYQPLWTLVGGGLVDKEDTVRNQIDYIPSDHTWIKQKVSTFQPEKNEVTLDNGDVLEYEFLVVAPGIKLDWQKIKGLEDTLGKNGVCSNYTFDNCRYTWDCLKSLKAGDNAVFMNPPLPIKCAGAPQKIVYLADDYLRRTGLRDKVNIEFALHGPRIFGVEKYRLALEKVLEKKQLKPRFEHSLVEVDGPNKVAYFNKVGTKEVVEVKFDMLHVVPPQSAPDFIKESPLAGAEGWVDVDKFTCQHTKYKNIFSLGDASSLPTSKTGAAIRKEAPVLVQNLLAAMAKKSLLAKYNGYTSCPIITSKGGLILCEFDYDGNPMESFPFDQAQERWSMYILKRYILPTLYWDGMLKGRA